MLLFGEGKADVGVESAGWDADARRGVVRIMMQAVLERHFGREIQDWEIAVERLPHLHGESGYVAKVRAAIKEARRRECSCVAVVVDRDRTTPGDRRMKRLQEGRADAQRGPDSRLAELAHRTALGVAVECVEAWLLADEVALTRALATPVGRVSNPETLAGKPGTDQHPKQVLLALFPRKIECSTGEMLERIAHEVEDPGTVESRCPSFGAYAAELRARAH